MNIIRLYAFQSVKIVLRTANSLLRYHKKLPSLLEDSTRTCSTLASLGTNFRRHTVERIVPERTPEEDEAISKEVLDNINRQIKERSHSRLFAIILFNSKRFKITAEDIIALPQYFPANVGDKIRLEKVILAGCADFTLLGRPLLNKDLLRIDATIIEKTFIVPRPLFRWGLHYRRLHWFRTPYVLIRINSIEFQHTLDELPDVEGLENRVIY